MAPALTKILKNDHGVHLSSPPASATVDSDGTAAMCSIEPCARPDDGDLQKMWLNLSPFSSLDSCLPPGLLDSPVASPKLLPCLQASAEMSLPSPGSLVNLLSFNKSQADAHQVASVFPGVPDMFLVPVPEHKSQEACALHGCSAALECGPDGGDVHRSSLTLSSVCPLHSQGEIQFQGYTPLLQTPPTQTQENAAAANRPPQAPLQPCINRVNLPQPACKAALEEAAREQLRRQAGLQGRAWRLRRRLQALLGEHALLHCCQQLEGLKKHHQLGDAPPDSLDSIYHGVLPSQSDSKPHPSWLESLSSYTEVREFSRSSQELLRGLQEALDSEATASSSSDEEPDEMIHGKASPVSYEKQWLAERAELSSRWSWLQLRLADLEGRIQQLVELHRHIRSTKGGVVLADSQPLTDRQIQQRLLREMAGLSCTASDADAEPCSPTRLLHNIERQSAQLSQFVNSLVTPLSFSPLSKKPQSCKGRRAASSGEQGDAVFLPGRSKRGRLGTRRLFKADASCVCARTRPLVTYHKPKLFALVPRNPGSSLDSGKSTSTFSSSLSSSSCSCCSSSCNPLVLCSDPDCSSGRSLSSSPSSSSRPHPMSSLSFGSPMCHHFQRTMAREEWFQRPLVINNQLSSPLNYKRHSSTPLHSGKKYKQHTRRHKNRVMDLSPIRLSGSARGQHSRAKRRKRKRTHIHGLMEDEEHGLCQVCDLEDSSDDVLEESCTRVSRKQASQGFVRKRQGESVYNINNIVIPVSLGKVEKLQYKDIVTPSWRVVDPLSLVEVEAEKDEDNEEEQVEDLGDEFFARRHLALEQREKLRWSSWGKRKCCRRRTRSGSRPLGSGGGMYTSGEESSAEWSCAQLDADEQPRAEERLPQTPWDPRVFPLDEDEEVALLSDELKKVPSVLTECSSASSTSKNSNSHFSPRHSPCATLPPNGQSKSSTPSGS
ncbi:KAT8 regulatory NSL complex subunit 1-like protein isoform X2 [Mugil cephalus]|uniref:KAT8 regulatory NSL complex subunit 1-like protein isoform X2 n=1 Tax=Mugil cephalus TaxID=48193 RepID=UPI001FB785AF|nr:KAT8 regulatory NSL complex subunit 1-like protein isoform X2 [Mugil cephalus]